MGDRLRRRRPRRRRPGSPPAPRPHADGPGGELSPQAAPQGRLGAFQEPITHAGEGVSFSGVRGSEVTVA
jgi:hypothetical protein